MKNRNYTIDFLRLIAASAVVIFHLNCKTNVSNAYKEIAVFGWLGVPIFFVISGFCIGMTSHCSKGVSDFFVRRFFRIFPTYWFSLIVVIAVAGFQFLYTGTNSVAALPRSFPDVSATVTLLTHPFSSIQTINGVYWSLTVEIFFYFIVGLSLLMPRRFQDVFLLSISLLTLFPNLSTIPMLFFLSDWAAFGIGFALYHIHDRKTRRILPWLLLLINGCSLILTKDVQYSLVASSTLLVVSMSIFWKDLPKNLFSKSGDYSYSIYLIHGPVSIFIHTLFKSSQTHTTMLYNILWDLAILLFVGLLSSLIFRYLELPSINLGRVASRKINSFKSTLTPVQSGVIQKSVIPIEHKEMV